MEEKNMRIEKARNIINKIFLLGIVGCLIGIVFVNATDIDVKMGTDGSGNNFFGIQNEMISRNIWFNLASDNNSNRPGIRPNTNKLQRFNTVVPWFKAKKIWFPEELKDSKEMVEMIDELSLASASGFKSLHNDCIDTISMLASLTAWKPSEYTPSPEESVNHLWEDWEDSNDYSSSYIV